MAEPRWLEPYPDVLLEDIADHAPGPDARYETKEAVALAFVTRLQHLAPRHAGRRGSGGQQHTGDSRNRGNRALRARSRRSDGSTTRRVRG
jgi:hypothetical protein